jgi:hypothetical protein
VLRDAVVVRLSPSVARLAMSSLEARPTLALLASLGEEQIVTRQLVTVNAVRLTGALTCWTFAAPRVLACGYDFEVCRIAASPVLAKMVELHLVGNITDEGKP